MNCQRCGAQNEEGSQFCKTCGIALGAAPYPPNYAPVYYAYPQPPAKQTNSLALIGLLLAVFVPFAGLVVSVIARKQCIERGEDGERLAKAGIIVGAIYSGVAFLAILAAVLIPLLIVSPLFNEAGVFGPMAMMVMMG
ncbi:MAG: zinc ribbon domain-containing protein [Firmicutes bacterium]|nr:zinc ribbon domain-containing protein [Bacillota bacterium]